jgi:hypothetical protein
MSVLYEDYEGLRCVDIPDIQRYDIAARYFRKTIFKTASGSGRLVSRRAQLHKESILKATAAASARVSKFCFHSSIPRIKLSL